MPSVSKKQHNLMAAVAKNPAFAKKVGIKQSVGEDFLQADKGKKFVKGGETMAKMKHDDEAQDKKLIAKMIKAAEKKEPKGMKCGGTPKKMASGGLAAGHKSADGIAKKGKTRAIAVKMCGGGMKKGK